MRASYLWLKELTGIGASPEDMAEKLTAVGLEVEAIHRFPAPDKVVVAEVKAIRPHPKRDKLRLVTLTDGSAEDEIVCGAPNVPEPGGRVLFAQLGAALPTESGAPFVISERAIGGVPSRGMICSESELGIGAGGEGIFVFGAAAPEPGTPLAAALPVGDAVFEIGLTPNRPDCLGHLGIARDLCALYGVPFTPPTPPAPPLRAEGAVPPSDARVALGWAEGGREVALEDDAGAGSFAIDIADAARCPRYGAAFVLGARVGPSPFWLRYRLHVLGLRSISNLVDATNLVMLERGHPIHGFDLAKLRGQRIEVRLATEGETLATLDGEERALTADDLLICDGEGPVALAGVMGGANSEIEAATRNVAIECAYFDPRSGGRPTPPPGVGTAPTPPQQRGGGPNPRPAPGPPAPPPKGGRRRGG
ncbi:MAG: phenylalanine--tRNA ligase subunit beta, partial [Myxococcota bacterium]